MTEILFALLGAALCATGLVFAARRSLVLGWLLIGASQAIGLALNALSGSWIFAAISGVLTALSAYCFVRAKRPAKTQS